MAVKRMSEKESLHFSLDMNWINFAEGDDVAWKDAGRLSQILLPLQTRGFWDGPGRLVETSTDKEIKVENLEAIAREVASGKGEFYRATLDNSALPCQLKIILFKGRFELEVELWVAPSDHDGIIEKINQLAVEINDIVLRFGNIGPVFALRLPDFDYPRPLPPRVDAWWPPNSLAYYVSTAHFSERAGASLKMLELLKETPLLPGMVRKEHGDLLVIQATDNVQDRESLAMQLHRLELWIGKTLELGFDRNFQSNGAQRARILSKDVVKPFSFYDASTKTGYKVVAEDRDDELDAETWKELEEALQLRALPDGRPVEATRVAFVEREAALKHLPKIRELGGSGVLYLGKEGDLWDPEPAGNWIRVDWEKV
jgi:hypothetical protein